nr:type III secretion system export apparatus subunit SctR [Pseudomonas fluorescens]
MQNIDALTLAVLLGGLSLLPLLMIICTAFLKVSMVLLITRNAIGVQQVPPNMALYGIALAATLFIMAPIFSEMSKRASSVSLPLEGYSTMVAAGQHVVQPLRQFMARNVDLDIQTHLLENAQRMWPKEMAENVARDDLLLIIPAFVLSELKAGFQIGFLIYIPFIVIDLIVSNILLALGMQMVAPMTVSLPLKILLFVLADGWTRLLDGLFYSYL